MAAAGTGPTAGATGTLDTDGPVLVDVPAADGHPLQGLLYPLPEPGRAEAAVLHVHGKGGNFYSGPPRTLPPLLAPDRFVHLSLNLRCHDLAYSLLGDSTDLGADARTASGGMWERLDDGPVDVRGGVHWLRERTGLPVHVVAHSAGGYFVGDWSPEADEVASRVLLSPLTSVRFPLSVWFGGDDEVAAARAQAEELVRAGHGHHLLTLPTWYFAISAESFLERLDEREDRWLHGCNASPVPLMLVWGGAEGRAPLWRALYDRMTVPDRSSLELPGAGHEYRGHEAALAVAVTAFVDAHS
ncbi:MAG: alpha/beta hydrolase family protein [Actinomycetes bacterium]